MLINKNNNNPFGAAKVSEPVQGPVGIMIDTPQNIPMAEEPGVVEQGVGLLKDKALTAGVEKATGVATKAMKGALTGATPATTAATVAGPAGMPVAAQAAGKGGAAAAGGATKAGLMAAAPMAAPLVIGGLLAAKLFK